MNKGFDKNLKNIINKNEVDNIIKKYKKIKKYMKTPIYELLNTEGTEKIVNNLLKEDPPKE
jgi:hypothetical protein